MEPELTLVCKSAASGACTVRWEDKTGRYHVWFNKEGELLQPLFKTPPSPITFGDDEFFNIRRLDADAACHAEVMKRVRRLASPYKIKWAINERFRLDREGVIREKTDRAEKIRKGFLIWIGNQGVDKDTIRVTSEDRLLSLLKLLKY